MKIIVDPFWPLSRHLLLILGLGFVPAAVIGLFVHHFIKSVLFSPLVVSVALMFGGIAIIVAERILAVGYIMSTEQIPLPTAVNIGFFQTLAMIPGTSRLAATIIGGRLLGLTRGAAAEFSFLLAIPTMLAASTYDLYENVGQINGNGALLLAIGFTCALVTAVLSVRWLVSFVSVHTFVLFGWYRIALGSVMLTSSVCRKT